MTLEVRQYEAQDALDIIQRQAKEPNLALNQQAQMDAQANADNGPAITGIWDGDCGAGSCRN